MDSVKTIRSIERAFEVLAALRTLPGGATLAQLQACTKLSKPTLMRLLKTLIGVKAVRRSMADQRYRTSIQLDVLARSMSTPDRLADVAAPILDDLRRELEWPSDLTLHLGDDDFMRVMESSLRQSRFYLRRRTGRVYVNLLGSAAGTAFLSALTASRCGELVRVARGGQDPHNLKVSASGTLEAHLEQARRLGYATRHALYRGGSYNAAPRDDALSSLAVPLRCQGLVFGSLNINWNRQALTEKEMAARSVGRLQQAAAAIVEEALQHGMDPEVFARNPARPVAAGDARRPECRPMLAAGGTHAPDRYDDSQIGG